MVVQLVAVVEVGTVVDVAAAVVVDDAPQPVVVVEMHSTDDVDVDYDRSIDVVMDLVKSVPGRYALDYCLHYNLLVITKKKRRFRLLFVCNIVCYWHDR